MRTLTLVSILWLVLLGGSASAFADTPTSPAGGMDTMASSLPERVIQRAREFRGNPVPLGVLTGLVLLVAAGLGVYTLALAYRQPDEIAGH